MRTTSIFNLLCGVTAAVSPIVAHAEDQPSDIVVTATGIAQPRDEVGHSITVIDRETIERRQTVSIAELIATTPGATYTRTGGAGALTALRIRGGEDRHTLTLIDGVRINDPSSTGGAFDFGNLLALTVDKVEVLRGANSVPWGSQAIGGVVNVVTAAPTDALEARANAEYGYNDAVSVTGHASGKRGPISASLSAGYFTDEGISAFRFGPEPDGYRQIAVAGNVDVALTEGVGLDLRGYYADSRRDQDGFPPPLFDFGDTGDYAKTRELVVYAGLHAELFDGALGNRIAFTQTNVDRDIYEPETQAAPTSAFRGIVQRIEYRGEAKIVDALTAVVGLEHEFARVNSAAYRTSTTATSGFVELIGRPAAGLTMTGGVRIDDYRTYGTKAIFSANAAWRLTDTLLVRANYAEGFKAPSLYQLYSAYGNVSLEPETAKNYELGAELRLAGGAMTLGLSGYQRDLERFIDFNFCIGQTTGICTNRPFGVYDNVGRIRVRGIETTMTLKPTDRLTLDANYSYTDSEDRETGLPLLRRPDHVVNLSVDWAAMDRFSIGGDIRAVSDSEDFRYQFPFDRLALDGYTLVTLRAVFDIGSHVQLYGRVENLFDAGYETVSGYGTYGRSAHVGIRAKL